MQKYTYRCAADQRYFTSCQLSLLLQFLRTAITVASLHHSLVIDSSDLRTPPLVVISPSYSAARRCHHRHTSAPDQPLASNIVIPQLTISILLVPVFDLRRLYSAFNLYDRPT